MCLPVRSRGISDELPGRVHTVCPIELPGTGSGDRPLTLGPSAGRLIDEDRDPLSA
jgi:hypothetical protein